MAAAFETQRWKGPLDGPAARRAARTSAALSGAACPAYAKDAAAALLLVLLAGAAIVLVSRRLAGALDGKLSLTELTVATVAAVLLAAFSRLLGRAAAAPHPPSQNFLNWQSSLSVLSLLTWQGLLKWVPLACLLLLAIALLPGAGIASCVIMGAIIAGEELWSLGAGSWLPRAAHATPRQAAAGLLPAPRRDSRRVRDTSELRRTDRRDRSSFLRPVQQAGRSGLPATAQGNTDPPTEADLPVQRIEHRFDAAGGLVVQGWLQAALEAGQRTATMHVAFCPPFSRAPQVTLRQVAGPEARIRAAQLLPYGVRIEIKLTSVAEKAARVRCRFRASAPKLNAAQPHANAEE